MLQRDQFVAAAVLAAILALAVWSYASGGVLALLLDPGLDSAAKIEGLRLFFASWGPFAPLVYIGLVIVEAVVAPIPGAMLYLPGGVIFGGFWGGTLSLIGNILAAGVCCVLMRTLAGRRWSQGFFEEGRLAAVQKLVVRHGVLSIALLRVNPLTSTDIVSYAAGLTPLSTRTVMLGTALGMAPLCYIQAYLSMELFTLFPWLIWPFLVGCGIYVVVAVLAIRRLRMPEFKQAADP